MPDKPASFQVSDAASCLYTPPLSSSKLTGSSPHPAADKVAATTAIIRDAIDFALTDISRFAFRSATGANCVRSVSQFETEGSVDPHTHWQALSQRWPPGLVSKAPCEKVLQRYLPDLSGIAIEVPGEEPGIQVNVYTRVIRRFRDTRRLRRLARYNAKIASGDRRHRLWCTAACDRSS